MTEVGPLSLFVDTGPFYARADEDDDHHDTATTVFDAIRANELPYRPIYTTQAVLSELATLLLYKIGHDYAVRAMRTIEESESINVVPVGRSAFETARVQFADYSDQDISFVDHTTGVLADERDVEHMFAFDSDFRTLGFRLVPEDVAIHG